MSEGNFKPEWNIFSHSKLSIQGEAWEKGGKDKPSLRFKVHANNPRFSVYMNDGRNSKPIPFALDPIIFQELIQVIRMVVASKEPSRYSFELKSGYDHRGNRTDKPAPVAKIYVGRDAESVVYIGFHAKEEKLAKFPFTPSYYAEILDAAGEKLTRELGSEIRAIAWSNALDALVGPFMVVHGKEPAEKPGQGGGKNKGGGWGKPAEKATTSWGDDDAAF